MTVLQRLSSLSTSLFWLLSVLLLLVVQRLLAPVTILPLVNAVRRYPGDVLHQHHSNNNNHDDTLNAPNNSDNGSDSDSDESQQHERRRRRRRLSLDSLFHRSLSIGRNVDVPTPTSPDDHLVDRRALPLLDVDAGRDLTHWAGLLPANDQGDKYLFYWLFAPDPQQLEDALKGDDMDPLKRNVEHETDIPLLIWLNGGPACSSMDGLWLENGPLRLVEQPTAGNDDGKSSSPSYKIEADPHSWHKAPAYVVYVDQPVGTGLAFTTSGHYPRNDRQVNDDFYYFLTQLLQLHGDKFLRPVQDDDGATSSSQTMTLKRPLFFSGESHAGHYIPSMMQYIQEQNRLPQSELYLPLAGAAIGNGWIDPVYQYSAQDAAYGYGLVGLAQKRHLEQEEQQCRKLIQQGQYVNSICFGLLDQVVANSQGSGSQYTVSQYDQRKWEVKNKPRDFPPGHKQVENYLGGHGTSVFGDSGQTYMDVLEAIHATPSKTAGQSYYECTDPPYNALKHQDGLGVVPDVVALLNTNTIRMLFFNGIHDLICNHVGNEEAVENFGWTYQTEYQKSERYGWKSTSTGQLAGYMKEYNNLMYLKVLDSGHMVPMDVPDVSLDMMRTFMFDKSFHTYKQDISGVKQGEGDNGAPSCPACPTCPEPEADHASNANVECPSCPDCDKVCKQQQQENSGDSSTQSKQEGDELSSSDLSNMSGIVWGAVTFFTLSACTFIVWMFCCKRSMSLSPRRRVGRDGYEYDMELSKTSNGAKGSSFRDDDGYLDDDDVNGMD